MRNMCPKCFELCELLSHCTVIRISFYFPELTHLTFDPDPLTTLWPHTHDDLKLQLTSAFTVAQEVVENNQPVCLQVKHLSEICSATA